MSGFIRRLVRDVRTLVLRRRADAELDAELSFHIEMEAAKHMRAGVEAREARRRALVAFGGVERHREATLATRPARRADDVARDLRQTVRLLVRTPAFALTTVLTVALGVGTATAMFSIADGVLLRGLVYADADRLYNLFEARTAGGIRQPSYPSFQDWERETRAFESLAYVRGDEFRLRGGEGTQRLLAGYVSGGFFRTVRAEPQLGRTFGDAEDAHGVVLSHELWQRRFGGDPEVIGRTIATADASFTVVGVMPAGFRIPAYADLWAPLAALPADVSHALTRRDLHVDSEAWGLLRADVTAEQAEADLSRVVANLARQYPETASDWTVASLVSAREQIIGDVRGQLRILTVAVALLLLIVCVNVAGLQLARGSARERELAVRTALGASRGRLVRQLLGESFVLAAAGGALGALLAWYAVPFLAQSFPFALPRMDEVGVDGRALGFAMATSAFAALAFGTLPALRLTAAGSHGALRERGGSGMSVRTQRLRGALVAAQVALALTLTIGSGLLLRSLAQLQRVDPGFDAEDIVALRVFPPARYGEPEAALGLYRELHDAVARVPGVESAALANHLPFAGGFMVTQVIAGAETPPGSDRAIVRTVSEEYFRVMRTRLLRGRLLAAEDYTTVGGGVVINDVLARDFFGSDDPVGRSITIFHSAQLRAEYGEPVQATVVGVVAAERFFRLEQDAPRAVFVPYTWMPWPNITIAVRTSAATAAPLAALRSAVQRIDVDIPVAGPSRQAEWRPLTHFMSDRNEPRTLLAGLLTGFATAALLLAALGIFGVTAYLVTQRTREIGVRAAIGAPPRALAGLILGHSLRLAGIGLLLGLPAAWGATRLLRSELFGVSAADPLTAGGAALALAVAALLAAALPTLRALRISPTEALRSD